ncbi:MAG: hypothetical protein M3252_09125 [Actinomycetota bacterium]|nr:hypothetical protein [Actinomycetota bacterium]
MSAAPSVLERLREFGTSRYDEAPALVQDLLCSAYGAQELVRRRGWPGPARRRMADIEALHWQPALAEAEVERRLRRILEVARRLPGYSSAPSRIASAPKELELWPALQKEQIRRDPKAFLSRTPSRSDIPSLSSGTSGKPLKVWRPRGTFRELFLSGDVFKGWHGLRPDARRASFTGKVVVPTSSSRVWRLNLPGKQLALSQYHLRPACTDRYAAALRRWRPQILDGYTSSLVELARLFRAAGIALRVPLIVTTSELLSPGGRVLLEEVFQGRVADKYGSSENGALAIECPAASRHVFLNVGIIEAVDDGDRPVPAGTPGRLLLTTLANDLMPLVRYEVGDVGSVDYEGCDCGRSSPILRDLLGREDDVVVARDGSRLALFAYNLLRGIDGVVAMQVVQQAPNSFLVRARLAREDETGHRAYENAILAAFDRLIGPDPDRVVTFAYGQEIERTPGGKIRNVIRAF